MKSSIAISFLLLMCYSVASGQIIQGTIKKSGGNKVDVFIRPDFNNNTQYLFQLQFPIAWPAGATPAPTGLTVTLDPTFVATFGSNYSVTVYPLANSTDATYRYFVISLVRGGAGASNPQTWTLGTEYKVLTAAFNNPSFPAPSAKVRLADWLDGGSDGQGNYYTVDGVGNYYVDGGGAGGNSVNNFYVAPGVSTVGGVAAAGYAETVPNVILPVEMLNFSGYRSGVRNILNWKTAFEQNNQGFEVQRSLDGVNYSPLGFVNSVAPSGNSSDELSYTFTDNNVTGTKQYYRLKQQDLNGASKLSNIVVIRGEKPLELTVDGLYPNPASSQVNVLIGSPVKDRVTLVVNDMAGRTVQQQVVSVSEGTNTVQLQVAGLTNGTYLVRLYGTTGIEAVMAKFVKQ